MNDMARLLLAKCDKAEERARRDGDPKIGELYQSAIRECRLAVTNCRDSSDYAYIEGMLDELRLIIYSMPVVLFKLMARVNARPTRGS